MVCTDFPNRWSIAVSHARECRWTLLTHAGRVAFECAWRDQVAALTLESDHAVIGLLDRIADRVAQEEVASCSAR